MNMKRSKRTQIKITNFPSLESDSPEEDQEFRHRERERERERDYINKE